MSGGYKHGAERRRERLRYAGLLSPAILLALAGAPAKAGQLPASAFQTYNAANAASIQAGPFALYTVNVGGIRPTQENEGFTEVGKKTAGFDLLSPAGLQAYLLTAIEPVVIGPGGTLYLTDGHHTFTALDNSIYGASNPTVYVNVIANYSNLTTAQFFQQMQSINFLLPLNDGVPQTVNTATGAPIPTTLTGLTNDPYRGLEYSILKNKSSVLFPTAANITGAVGSSTPGLDKMTGFYSDFLEAAAYRGAYNGRGLPYLSPGDAAIATQWNLNAASTTTLPNVAGTVTAAQLPGFILSQNITLNGGISNTTLAGGAIAGNGTFTGITQINAGTAAAPIIIGTPNTGFVMQLGADKGYGVTLNGTNTYTGGTSILAGNLTVASDASLGAAPTNAAIDPNNVRSTVQAANGIVFNSLSEGNGTLTLGTTAGNGTATFASSRPIAVSGETAIININGYQTTLGPLYSFGSGGIGLGNATGESDLTIDDNSANKGVLTLSTPSPYFYGNIIIGNTNAPTVKVMNDAALGNTTGNPASIGQVELNGGTLQAGASFTATERNLFLGGGSNFDVNGFATSWGTLTDVQRTLKILNSNTTTAGAVTFSGLTFGATATLQLAGGAAGETVTLTNGLTRQAGATLILQPTSATSLGTATEKVFSGTGTASVVNGIAPAYIVTNNGVSGSGGPYDFVTYGSNGYVKATYSQTTLTNTPTSTVALAANTTATSNVAAFALNTEGKTITLGAGNTLTLGDGTNPGGLILATGSAITGGTLAFGGSEGVIWLSGTNPTISSQITGSNGLTFAGSGGVTLSTAANVSGAINIDSGTVTLAAANVFAGDTAGVTLANVKSKPAFATLNVTADNAFSTLNSVGTNSTINISNGAHLTIGDTNNLGSTLSSAITQTGAATLGALTFNGTGLADLSAGKSITLAAGSTIVVNGGALRLTASELKSSAFGITLNGTSDLQFAQNGGGVLANQVTGTGTLHLIGGTLQITGTTNTYSGGTIVETGSVLDVTTANLPATNPNITNAGGLVVFDQATNGTYAGVISDGKQLGVGATFSGSFDKDDSTGANAGNVTLAKAQTYTGGTYVEAGTLTLGAVDTVATSSGVDLGRVGGGANATLALGANNTIQALSSETGNTTAVTLGTNTLTIADAAATATNFGGTISGTGNLVKTGAGTQILSGTNGYTGTTSVDGGTLLGGAANTFSAMSATSVATGGTLDLGGYAQQINAVALAGGTLRNGALTGAVTSTSGTIDTLGGPATLTTTAGTTVAINTNTYTGATNVDGGTFEVDGSVTASNITVNNGGTLSGTGKIGDPTINAGGTLAPGNAANPYGTLTIVGPLTFEPGSFYAVRIAPRQNSRVNVVGTTTISGGTVEVTSASRQLPANRRYTILTATGGVNGRFAPTPISNLAFSQPMLSYDANDVYLTNRVNYVMTGGTQNEQNVGAGLNGASSGASGSGRKVLNALNQVSSVQGRAVLDSLSGEGITAAQNVAYRSSQLFTSSIFDQTTFYKGAANSITLTAPPIRELADLPAKQFQPIAPAAPARTWRAWATGWGGVENIAGNGAVGSAAQQSQIYGGSLGVDYQLTPNYLLGVAVGGSNGDFWVNQRSTSGTTIGGHIAIYDLYELGPYYGASSTAFSYFGNQTTRFVSGFGGLGSESERGNFNSDEFRSRFEFGRHFTGLPAFAGLPALGGFGEVTPFVALEIAELRSNGFTESPLKDGPGLFRLNVSGQSAASVPAFLGLRFQLVTPFGDGMVLSPTLQLAYVHEFAPYRDQIGQLASLPGSTFLVDGARPARDAAQVKAGAELALGPHSALFANFEGEFSGVNQLYAGKGGFRYTW